MKEPRPGQRIDSIVMDLWRRMEDRSSIGIRDVVDWLLLLALVAAAYRMTNAIEKIAEAFS